MSRFGLHIGFCLGLIFSLIPQLYAQKIVDSVHLKAAMSIYDAPDKTIEIAKQIIEENQDNSEKQIKAYLLLSNAEASKRNFEKALEYALTAQKQYDSQTNTVTKLSVLSQIAVQYFQLGIFENALETLDEAEKLAQFSDHSSSLSKNFCNNYAIRGLIYVEQLNCEIAITYFQKAAECYSKDPENLQFIANLGMVNYNKGNCYIALNELGLAKKSFLDSYEFSKQADSKKMKAFSLKGLAEVYTLEKKYQEALNTLDEVQKLSTVSEDSVLNSKIYKGMADNYLGLNDWDNYQIFNDKYKNSLQIIKQNENKIHNNLLITQTKEMKQKSNEQNWKYIGIITAGFFFLVLVVIFIIKGEMSFQKALSRVKSHIKF